jgi:hypothetical protein
MRIVLQVAEKGLAKTFRKNHPAIDKKEWILR